MMPEDWSKFNLDIAASAIGFLFALLVNSFVNRRLDKKTYYSMLAAIKNEAKSNKKILEDSFMKYFDSGIVLRGFSLANVEPHILDTLNSYLRKLN
jgi:hypothetical protein